MRVAGGGEEDSERLKGCARLEMVLLGRTGRGEAVLAVKSFQSGKRFFQDETDWSKRKSVT